MVSAVGVALKAFITKATELEGHDTNYSPSRFSKLSMALLMNSVLVPLGLAVVHSLRVSGYLRLVDQSWYEDGSIVDDAVYLPVFNFAVYSFLTLVPFTLLFNSLFAVHFAHSLYTFNELSAPVQCDIASLYVTLVVYVALCFVYSPMYPVLYLITALVFLGRGALASMLASGSTQSLPPSTKQWPNRRARCSSISCCFCWSRCGFPTAMSAPRSRRALGQDW